MNESSLNPNPSDPSISPPDQVQWQEQRSALKWPLIVLFGLPMVALAVGIFMMVMASKMPKSEQGLIDKATVAIGGQGAVVDKDAKIAQLQAQIGQLQAAANGNVAQPVSPSFQSGAVTYTQADISSLSARVDRLELQQKETTRFASAVYATHILTEAAMGSAPFVSELTAAEQVMGPNEALEALKPLAQKGVASKSELILSFPVAAAKANAAAPVKGEKPGLMAQLMAGFRSIISIRRVDQTDGQDVPAILHRSELALAEGHVDVALTYLAGLPIESQKAMASWLESAKARVMVDQTTRHLSESSLSQMGRVNMTASAVPQGAM
jgi:hypothetical protein